MIFLKQIIRKTTALLTRYTKYRNTKTVEFASKYNNILFNAYFKIND